MKRRVRASCSLWAGIALVLLVFAGAAAAAQVEVSIGKYEAMNSDSSTGSGESLQAAVEAAQAAAATDLFPDGLLSVKSLTAVSKTSGVDEYRLTPKDFEYLQDNMQRILTLDFSRIRAVDDAVPRCALSFLVRVYLPPYTKNIGKEAFAGCFDLVAVYGTRWVESVGDEAFNTCRKLSNETNGVLQFPMLRHIGEKAFFLCENVKYFHAPSLGNTGSIGPNAFDRCYGLIHMVFGNGAPQTTGVVFGTYPPDEMVYYLENYSGWNEAIFNTPKSSRWVYRRPTTPYGASLSATELRFDANGPAQVVTAAYDEYRYLGYSWSITGTAAGLSNFTHDLGTKRVGATVTPGSVAGGGNVVFTRIADTDIANFTSGYPDPLPWVEYPFQASIPYTVVGPVVPVSTVSLHDASVGLSYEARQEDTTWWAAIPSGLSSRSYVVVRVRDGKTYKSVPISFIAGSPQLVEVKTEDGSASEQIRVGIRISDKRDVQPTLPTPRTVETVVDVYDLPHQTYPVPAGSVFINTLPDKPSTVEPSLVDYMNRHALAILDYMAALVDQKPKVPADPVVVAAGLTFTISSTLEGVSVEKPKDLPDALNKLSFNKIFDVDANGTPTMMDLFELMKPYLASGAVTYNLFTGELKLNVPVTVVDGPVPDGATGVTRPMPGSKYGVIFDPVGGLLIYDGVEDGIVFDPLALMTKTATPVVLPTALALSPSGLILKRDESRAVTVLWTPADTTERDLVWTVANPSVVSVAKTENADVWTVKALAAGTTEVFAVAAADKNVKAVLPVTVPSDDPEDPEDPDGPIGSLIRTLTVSPPPPYRPGDRVEVLAAFRRVPADVSVSVVRPDGTEDEPEVTLDGTGAWAAYTLPEFGAYVVALTATEAAGPARKIVVLRVTERGVTVDDGGGGGCNAGLGLTAVAVLLAARRRRD